MLPTCPCRREGSHMAYCPRILISPISFGLISSHCLCGRLTDKNARKRKHKNANEVDCLDLQINLVFNGHSYLMLGGVISCRLIWLNAAGFRQVCPGSKDSGAAGSEPERSQQDLLGPMRHGSMRQRWVCFSVTSRHHKQTKRWMNFESLLLKEVVCYLWSLLFSFSFCYLSWCLLIVISDDCFIYSWLMS